MYRSVLTCGLTYNCAMKSAFDLSLIPAIDKRYQQLIKRTQQLPPRGSRPLTVSGRVAGWITARATQVLRGVPGVEISAEAVHITNSAAPCLSLDKVLENVARVLNEGGCVRGWRNELLDVIGEGQRLGVIERAALRPLGLLTTAVHFNAWTPEGHLWIARRAPTKSTNPNMWDTLVGGLTAAGESREDSLLRESNEEAGLQPADMAARTPLRTILRMHRRLPEGYQVENVLVSEGVLDAAVVPHNLDGEVSEIRAVPLEQAWELACADEFTLEAELVVLDCLLKRLDGPRATRSVPAAPQAASPQAR